jgi:hypothetical protein
MLPDRKIIPVQRANPVDQLLDQALPESNHLFCLISQVLQFINDFRLQIKQLLLQTGARRGILALAVNSEKLEIGAEIEK